MNTAALRATMRIARRDAWRHRGRSLLIVLMIAIPVLGLVATDVLARTVQLSGKELAARNIGTADIGIRIPGGTISDPSADGLFFSTSRRIYLTPTSSRFQDLKAQSLKLVHATSTTTVTDDFKRFTANGFRVPAIVDRVDFANPLTHGLIDWRSGSAPTATTQVALSEPLAAQLHVGIGQNVSFAGHTWRVSALVRDPRQLDNGIAYVLPSALAAPNYGSPLILARTSSPVPYQTVLKLGSMGVVGSSASVIINPPADLSPAALFPDVNKDRVGVATVAGGLAVLEVILIAAAAFAVGARRQRRDLALIAAVGGDSRRVAQVVLASGLVLGGVGAVVGVPLGILTAKIALPHVANTLNRAPGHFDIRVLEVLGVMVLGIVTGLIAALLPARAAARDDVVGALAGRRMTTRVTKSIPVAGLALIIIGAAMAVYEAKHDHFKRILTGAVICELGFVACAPTVVGWVGKLAGRLPLAPRLALRDASRHRGRTGPAVAAVMAAIAGCISVSTYIVSDTHQQRAEYIPRGLVGTSVVTFSGAVSQAERAAQVADLRRDFDANRVTSLVTATCEPGKNGGCHRIAEGPLDYRSAVAVGGPSLLRTVTGTVNPAAERALAVGKFLQFASQAGVGSQPPVYIDDFPARIGSAPSYVDVVGAKGAAVSGMISPAVAARYHLHTTVTSYLLAGPKFPTGAEESTARNQLNLRQATLQVERGYQPGKLGSGEVVLVLMAALVALGATAISLGLSMAEGRPDLATLSAVGSRPLTRRLLVANQAAVVALLGAVLGIVAGFVPAWAILHANGAIPFTMPWTTVLLAALGIPAAAMVFSAAFAGTKTTLERRLT